MSETQTTETETWELAGWAGVDSARLMLADPSYPEMMSEEFLAGIDKTGAMLDDGGGISRWRGIAMIVPTQNGDGLFPVRVMRDEMGRITAVRVDFTQEARAAAH